MLMQNLRKQKKIKIIKMNHKILTKFIKDISFEVPDVETFLFFEENINKYELAVDIISKPLKKA